MNETNWKPTEEELISLGFAKYSDYLFLDTSSATIFFYPKDGGFLLGFDDVYPKSLEELRLLISMMNP